jgi:hypothetical protein
MLYYYLMVVFTIRYNHIRTEKLSVLRVDVVYVPAGKRAETKDLAFCPAFVVPVGQPGQPLRGRDNRHVIH